MNEREKSRKVTHSHIQFFNKVTNMHHGVMVDFSEKISVVKNSIK